MLILRLLQVFRKGVYHSYDYLQTEYLATTQTTQEITVVNLENNMWFHFTNIKK